MSDIELVPTEDLIAELFRRHDAVVVLRMKTLVSGSTQSSGKEELLSDFQGGAYNAIGMCENMKHRLLGPLSQLVSEE